jgi:hypothetical protein
MRWKIIGVSSLAAAVVGVTLWSLVVITAFGSARALAKHDWFLLASALIPLGLILFAGLFVYRHTARRRKTQALITLLLSLILTPAAYLAARALLPQRLYLPVMREVRFSP